MKTRVIFLVVIAVLMAPVVGLYQPGAKARALQDAQDENDELRRRVRKLEEHMALVDANLANHQELLKGIFGWFRELPTKCTTLDESMDNARKNGFEYAGPNPRAKSNVLDGLKSFAKSLRNGNPAFPQASTKKK